MEEEGQEEEESQKEHHAGLKTWRFQICINRLEITWCDHLEAETNLICSTISTNYVHHWNRWEVTKRKFL